MAEPILVLGATGTTGRRVAQALRAAGHPVRGASRHGEVRFDWADPRTWEPATSGAAAMYLMVPDGLPLDPVFVALAVEQGVRRVVLLSSMAIEAMGDERLTTAERVVRESGAEWTIVRPSWFNQNFDEGVFAPAVLAGELALPLGELRQAFVDAEDIAAVAATALSRDGHAGRSYDLTGPDALSFAEALDLIGAAAGRPVRFRPDAEAYVESRVALGASRDDAMTELDAYIALRGLGDQQPGGTVRQVTGRDPKSFAQFVAEAAARGAWQRSGVQRSTT